MNRQIVAIVLALTAITHTTGLKAQAALPFAYERVRGQDELRLDPARAYLLVETPMGGEIEFFKLATSAEREEWERARDTALAEAGQSNVNGWPAAESQLRLRISATSAAFERNRNGLLHLYEVPEGTYVFYSHNTWNTRDCACMGSVSFPVSVGSVTALRVERKYLDAQGHVLPQMPREGSAMARLMQTGLAVSPPTDATFDPRLPRDMIRVAEFAPVPEVPNWGRFIINRVLPVPGLFHYQGSTMVDERPASGSTDN